ncbi:hypothetical protein ZHAS_00003347 [Anopheles sinensis]|uniref:Uncharacterized protein n=1 Tax=Anopheles sinensis TaxID=74873 RepID=A0A084VE40_ANOSI|nr:hypothetical protein ZHAS_00003347 [Anopheles sinensis]
MFRLLRLGLLPAKRWVKPTSSTRGAPQIPNRCYRDPSIDHLINHNAPCTPIRNIVIYVAVLIITTIIFAMCSSDHGATTLAKDKPGRRRCLFRYALSDPRPNRNAVSADNVASRFRVCKYLSRLQCHAIPGPVRANTAGDSDRAYHQVLGTPVIEPVASWKIM